MTKQEVYAELESQMAMVDGFNVTLSCILQSCANDGLLKKLYDVALTASDVRRFYRRQLYKLYDEFSRFDAKGGLNG